MSRKPKVVVVQYPPSAVGGYEAFTHQQLVDRYKGEKDLASYTWDVPVQYAFSEPQQVSHLSLVGGSTKFEVGAWVQQTVHYHAMDAVDNRHYGLIGVITGVFDKTARAWFYENVVPAGSEMLTVTYLTL